MCLRSPLPALCHPQQLVWTQVRTNRGDLLRQIPARQVLGGKRDFVSRLKVFVAAPEGFFWSRCSWIIWVSWAQNVFSRKSFTWCDRSFRTNTDYVEGEQIMKLTLYFSLLSSLWPYEKLLRKGGLSRRQYSLPRPASYPNNKFINSEYWACTRWWISAPQIAIKQASLVDGCPLFWLSDVVLWFHLSRDCYDCWSDCRNCGWTDWIRSFLKDWASKQKVNYSGM